MSEDETAGWAEELERLGARIAPCFGRKESRRRAMTYLHGLLAPLPRKNGWQLAEAVGDRTPDAMQDFLRRMRWNADAVRNHLQAYVIEHLGDPGAVLVLDETGFVKKGTKSVGVQRQYSGTAGRVENCQIGVFLAYASTKGHALIDRALYLPESWAGDAARRGEAGVPEEVAFTTKPKLGRRMLERAFKAGVPCAWVTGDSVYGSDSSLRRDCERRLVGYVLAVTSAQRLGGRDVARWAEAMPAKAWQRLSAGDGTKGPRLYDWAYAPYHASAPPGWRKGLLVRRSIAKPDELTFYLTLAPPDIELATLVRVAGTRWTVEACFEAAKGEVGLDEYEVRSWTGWYRHITLAMLAHAYLAVVRKAAVGGRGQARLGCRVAAADRAGGAPPALALSLGAPAPTRGGAGMVALAPPPSATGTTLPLAATHQLP